MKNPHEDLSIEEVKRRLKEMGVPTGKWEDSQAEEDVEITTIPTFRRIADGLKQLGGLVEEQIERDQKQIMELNLKLARLKHGGGR